MSSPEPLPPSLPEQDDALLDLISPYRDAVGDPVAPGGPGEPGQADVAEQTQTAVSGSAGVPDGQDPEALGQAPGQAEERAEDLTRDRCDPPGAGETNGTDREELRAASTPDVAVEVTPVRLPPSYPPLRRPDAQAPTGAAPSEAAPEQRRSLRGALGVILTVLLVSALLKTFVVQTFEIPSGSMENTLVSGDRVLVTVYDADDVERGDIVVFSDPDHWLNVEEPTGVRRAVQDVLIVLHLLPEDSGHHLIKRVIGMPGDHVVADGKGAVSVNGVPLDESYLKDGVAASTVAFDVTVPDGFVWVMGDNRANSADSRYHQEDAHAGFVPVDDVVGVAKQVIWPLTRWHGVDGGISVFEPVPAPTREAPAPATPAPEDGA